jgi:hypothetical protein
VLAGRGRSPTSSETFMLVSYSAATDPIYA